MKFPALLATLIPVLAPGASAQTLLIGTRTQGESEGIYAAEFDAETGELANLRLAAETDNPGFLAYHPTLPVVYAIGSRSVRGYRYSSTAELTPINQKDCGAGGTCHLEVAPDGSLLAAANYGGGSVSWFRLADDGRILGDAEIFQHRGKSIHPDRQRGPHAHGTHFHGDTLWVPDLGADRIFAYRIGDGPALAPAEPPSIATQASDGPRHLAVHPDGQHVFAIHELSSVAEVSRIRGTDLESLARVSTLPEDWSGEINTTAEIVVHPNGRWVFASNRGHDSIAVLEFSAAEGTLAVHDIVAAESKHPRHFTLSPDSGHLIVAGRDSDHLRVFDFDADTGTLTAASGRLEVPDPICVLFLPEKS